MCSKIKKIHSANRHIEFGKSHCNDQYVGTFIFSKGCFVNHAKGFNLTRKNNPNGQKRKTINYRKRVLLNIKIRPRIVVLLESPHINEYTATGQSSNNTAPAWGGTGNVFNSHFLGVLNNHIGVIKSNSQVLNKGDRKFNVYIVNSIQYQCSQGRDLSKKANKQTRDNNFIRLWNGDFKEDLITRLNIIKPDIIINACTINLIRTCVNDSSLVECIGHKKAAYFEFDRHMSCWYLNANIRSFKSNNK